MESFYAHFEKLTDSLLARSQDILRERFGIADGHPKTLEEIGKKYRITRERVRQIIRSSLKDVQSRNKASFQEIEKRIETALNDRSGIMSESDIVKVLGKSNPEEVAALHFFLECLSTIQLLKEDVHRQRAYAIKNFPSDVWKAIVRDTVQVLEGEKEAIEKKVLLEKISRKNASPITGQQFFDYLAVSKEVKQNAFGRFGLRFWSDVSPKGTREKAHLILKSMHKPLHFREITGLIDAYGLNKNSKKKTHPQTVHNELIKDDRFILVGRGTYALSEWGYVQGTVSDVIREVLRKEGAPMNRADIIEKVLSIRQVLKSTIIINLNTFFAKVGKDAYTLK